MNKYIAKVVREIEYKVEVEAIDADNARIKACEDYETKGELISDWIHPVFVEEKESEPKEPKRKKINWSHYEVGNWEYSLDDFLKEGETPLECIVRTRKDVSAAFNALAKCVKEKEELQAQLNQQPQKPKCKTHPDAPHGFCRDASHSEDRYVCECEFWEEPKEPKYLYIHRYRDGKGINIAEENLEDSDIWKYIGKIKLEEDDK